jgi:hypothetical protein
MKAPAIGELDQLAKVRRWQDQPTIGGSIDQTFDAGVDAWIRIVPAGAALFYGSAQVEAGITHRAATWRTPELNARTVTGEHVLEVDGLRYRVKRATNMDQGGQFVLFDLVELGTINAG